MRAVVHRLTERLARPEDVALRERDVARAALREQMRLVAVEGVEERVIADYTFNHYPS